MCLGIPMQVIGFNGDYAVCERDGTQHLIDPILVGKPEIGAWILTFLETAREIISPEQAAQIQDALQALTLTLQGDYNVDHLFADLVNREPQLPDFLCEK
ncbi:MAG: HypC/HybG/HupF family hydrogenase formation chaperone [Methylococcales bacterium]|nr:HypC/HybG/HupF family hydrogenase formation chaperone [Methylococcales bacterium]MDD5754656.1 HypC/HybG/HupF family hydrogenase formation chaperone [Methylococcales bacterium]